MCGFAGLLGADSCETHLRDMGTALHHRGPDDSGIWRDANAQIGLSFRRLSIQDLSEAGHQPMHSASARYVIVFNGEIYNHLDLRAALQKSGDAPAWNGHSDTETLLAGFSTWGVRGAIERAAGMFAFAVWDRDERTLTLGRDRAGEKPLYYGWQNGTFLFGSDLAALREHPSFRGEIDRGALALLMRHNYIPAPYSIYKDFHKLLPGTLLSVSLDRREPRLTHYWDGRAAVQTGAATPFNGSPEAAVDCLEELLRDVVRGQMISDVPLGAFLSGGIDSSLIVALMQSLSTRPVRTFSIGFREAGYDEAVYAKQVAAHLGTDHTELYVSPREARDVIPLLPRIYSEPFADSSQIPTFLVSQLARQHVTVSLSGDGGDELFGGYDRYLLSQRFWRQLNRMPAAARSVLARTITAIPPRTWKRALAPINAVLRRGDSRHGIDDRLLKGAEVLASRDALQLYHNMVSHWTRPADVVRGATEPSTVLTDPARRPHTGHFVHDMMGLDLLTYLPDDILVKVDRAAMANSLETRVPLLDHRVIEFAWSLPLDYKLRDGATKWPLRELLYRMVPRALIERPKMGFGVPIDSWLRGPLKEWAADLLDPSRLRREGYFQPEPIQEKWNDHISGRRNWHYLLWDVLMFQAWLAEQA